MCVIKLAEVEEKKLSVYKWPVFSQFSLLFMLCNSPPFSLERKADYTEQVSTIKGAEHAMNRQYRRIWLVGIWMLSEMEQSLTTKVTH